MKRLEVLTSHDRERRGIVRQLGDHAFVVLRIPGRGGDKGLALPLAEVLDCEDACRICTHGGDRRRRVGTQSRAPSKRRVFAGALSY